MQDEELNGTEGDISRRCRWEVVIVYIVINKLPKSGNVFFSFKIGRRMFLFSLYRS